VLRDDGAGFDTPNLGRSQRRMPPCSMPVGSMSVGSMSVGSMSVGSMLIPGFCQIQTAAMDQVGGDGDAIEISGVKAAESVPSGTAQPPFRLRSCRFEVIVHEHHGFAHAHA
jgi:hypothetical protein